MTAPFTQGSLGCGAKLKDKLQFAVLPRGRLHLRVFWGMIRKESFAEEET